MQLTGNAERPAVCRKTSTEMNHSTRTADEEAPATAHQGRREALDGSLTGQKEPGPDDL